MTKKATFHGFAMTDGERIRATLTLARWRLYGTTWSVVSDILKMQKSDFSNILQVIEDAAEVQKSKVIRQILASILFFTSLTWIVVDRANLSNVSNPSIWPIEPEFDEYQSTGLKPNLSNISQISLVTQDYGPINPSKVSKASKIGIAKKTTKMIQSDKKLDLNGSHISGPLPASCSCSDGSRVIPRHENGCLVGAENRQLLSRERAGLQKWFSEIGELPQTSERDLLPWKHREDIEGLREVGIC